MTRAAHSFFPYTSYLAICLILVIGSPAWAQDPDPAPIIDSYSFEVSATKQWKMPLSLKEVSGLALTSDGRLFGHDDERAIILELSIPDTRLIKAFALGLIQEQIAVDDFEGIAVAGEWIYLVTSNGRLYRAREGRNGEQVAYDTFSTGLSETCEIEGLEYEEANQTLLLPCKNPRAKALKGTVAVFRWSVAQDRLLSEATLRISEDALAGPLGTKRFQPSGIALSPGGATYLLVAARQNAIAEVTRDGRVLAVRALPPWHRQTEGITVLPNGDLVLADEGAGRRGRLTLYPRPAKP